MPSPDHRDDFDAPESTSFRKLVHHVVDEMPARVIVAITFVAFMFFYGMVSTLYLTTGRSFAELEFPLGVVSGTVGSLALFFWLIRIKYRRK